MAERKSTREVRIGDVVIGGNHPIAIQSMTNTKTQDVEATVAQILQLERAGCQIIRSTVPDMEAAKALQEIKKQIHIPLVADIHFDYRLAIAAMENGADKIRINPGNIGSAERVKAVVDCARERNIPIRVGVNSGSLEKELVEKYHGVTAEGIVESALDKVKMIEDFGYDNLVISIKSSDVMMCVKAHELISKQTDYPLHVGITESGTIISGNIKSSIGLGTDPKSGDWRYNPCISDRRSGGRNQISQADSENTGAEKRWYRDCFLSDLWTYQSGSDRSGK